jgi:hypothetical protein
VIKSKKKKAEQRFSRFPAMINKEKESAPSAAKLQYSRVAPAAEENNR